MGLAFRVSAVLVIAAAASRTADPDPSELFARARKRVLERTQRLPRYTCVETVSRSQYLPAPDATGGCADLASRRSKDDRGGLVMQDRLRLDVAVINGDEIFAWAGARQFETNDVNQLVGGGASGSGDFGSFLTSVFGSAPDAVRYQGLRNNLALFEYVVPLVRSNYRYRSTARGNPKITGYHGTFALNPADAEVRQLVVDTDEFDPDDRACSVHHVMDYGRVKIGGEDFLLPAVSTMDALYRDGGRSVNETHYSTCREYVGESTIRFDDGESTVKPAKPASRRPQPMPPGTRVEIALATRIDTEVAAAGDQVTGIATVGRETDRVFGRILRLGLFMAPRPRWILGLRFDTVERGGVMQPLSLTPIDGNARSPFTGVSSDTGIFVFNLSDAVAPDRLVLDERFQSVWETR